MRCYIGLDNGGTTTKASVFDDRGNQLSSFGVATPTSSPRRGFVERDMEELWEANCTVIRAAIERSGISGDDIRGVAVCGHGKGLYLWGRDGRPVRPGIASTDSRARAYVEGWVEDGTAKHAFGISRQEVLACQPPALLAWLRDNEPAAYSNIRYVFECKDFIRFMLTGEARAELSDYSGTSLMNLETRSFDPVLFELFGIPEMLGCMPELCRCDEAAGWVSAAAAEKTGLPEGTPVAGGFFDIDACAVGSGVVGPGPVCMVAGTWSINEYVRDEPVIDGGVSKNSCFCVPGTYLVEESSPTSAGNNEWFVRNLLPDVCEQAEETGKSAYDVVNDWVASVPAERAVPIFLPFLMGSNASPLAEGAFIGLREGCSRRELARSVYEGIVFCHRQHFDRLLASMPCPPEVIRLTGGAARSRVWAQIFADVMRVPVETVEAQEVGALGCAAAASVACGDSPDIEAAVRDMVRVADRYEPDPEASRVYDRKYQRYRRVVECLDPVWEDLRSPAED